MKKNYFSTIIDPVNDYTFQHRLDELRARKKEQTQWKIRNAGNMDEDDYGYVPPPVAFVFSPECNDPVNQTFYGADLWSRNFSSLLKIHPVYVDLNDALCGRWMFILQRFRPFENAISNKNMEMAPVFDYEWLKPDQQLYDLLPGIGKMHHFAPDYRIGLSLGWDGIKEKVLRYQAVNLSEESQSLYRAELTVLEGIETWFSIPLRL